VQSPIFSPLYLDGSVASLFLSLLLSILARLSDYVSSTRLGGQMVEEEQKEEADADAEKGWMHALLKGDVGSMDGRSRS
jgi:hypothetical protein